MIYSVPDMSCGHCKAAIEEAISKAKGHVTVDLSQKQITVTGLEQADVESALSAIGFPARLISAA